MGEVKNFLQDLNIRWHGFHGDVYDIDVPGYHLYFYDESSMSQVDMYISSTGYLYCGHATYRIVSSSLEKVWTQLDSLYKLADNGESFDAAYKRMKKPPEGSHGFLSGGFLYKRRSRKD